MFLWAASLILTLIGTFIDLSLAQNIALLKECLVLNDSDL